jgi:ketosteroid isomerase-like protein
MKKTVLLLTAYCLLLTLLVACGGEAAGDAAATTVERYLTAKVAGDADTVQALLCADMEKDLLRETQAFTSVTDAHIEEMACTKAADRDIVQCTGTIIALYGAEQTEFQLSSYAVVQEDGEWKWCGEGE